MTEPFKEGDRVKYADADDPRSIPAYRSMRGTVIHDQQNASVLVQWECDKEAGIGPSRMPASWLAKADD